MIGRNGPNDAKMLCPGAAGIRGERQICEQ
jgi:hypothetical protein